LRPADASKCVRLRAGSATENAGLENAGPSKMQGWKMRDWKTRDHNTGGGKRETISYGTPN